MTTFDEQRIGLGQKSPDPLHQADSSAQRAGSPSGIIKGWEERDDWIAACVRWGMNAREIRDFSLSWPQPVTTTQQVYDKISQLNLERAYKSKKTKKRRIGYHNETLLISIAKLCGQAMEYGYEVRDVLREQKPDESVRFQADFGMNIGNRQFFGEVQTSKIQYTRWGEKFRNYLKLREITKKRFSVLFLVDKEDQILNLRTGAKYVLKNNPDLNMFLFIGIDEFKRSRDVLRAEVWHGAWDAKERFSLM